MGVAGQRAATIPFHEYPAHEEPSLRLPCCSAGGGVNHDFSRNFPQVPRHPHLFQIPLKKAQPVCARDAQRQRGVELREALGDDARRGSSPCRWFGRKYRIACAVCLSWFKGQVCLLCPQKARASQTRRSAGLAVARLARRWRALAAATALLPTTALTPWHRVVHPATTPALT